MRPIGVRVRNKRPYKFCRCAACSPPRDMENLRARQRVDDRAEIDEHLEDPIHPAEVELMDHDVAVRLTDDFIQSLAAVTLAWARGQS